VNRDSAHRREQRKISWGKIEMPLGTSIGLKSMFLNDSQ